MTDSSPPAYKVDCSQAVFNELKNLLQKAHHLGATVKSRYSQALVEIYHKLEANPHGWGSWLHSLEKAKLEVYHAIYDRMHVKYYVHEDTRMVFLQYIKPITGHPLAEASTNGEKFSG